MGDVCSSSGGWAAPGAAPGGPTPCCGAPAPIAPASPVLDSARRRRRAVETGATRGRLQPAANVSWTAAGAVASAGGKWLVLVVLARMGDPRSLGAFALGLAIVAPIMAFASLRLRAVQATDASGEFLFSDYFLLRLVTTTAAVAVVWAAATAYGVDLSTQLMVLAVALSRGVESISDIYYGRWQQLERMDWIGKSMMAKSAAGPAALAVVLYASGNALEAVMAWAAVNGAVLVLYDARPPGPPAAQGAGGWRWRPAAVRRLALLTAPMGAVFLLESLSVNIPRYFVERLGGLEALGHYVAVSYVPIASALLVTCVGVAYQPVIARLYHQNRRRLQSLLRRLAGGMGVGGVGAVVACHWLGAPLLSLIYGPPYQQYAWLLTSLMAAAAVGYLYLLADCILTAARGFRQLLAVQICSTAALAAGLFLAPFQSPLAAAAFAMALREVARLLAGFVMAARCLRETQPLARTA